MTEVSKRLSILLSCWLICKAWKHPVEQAQLHSPRGCLPSPLAGSCVTRIVTDAGMTSTSATTAILALSPNVMPCPRRESTAVLLRRRNRRSQVWRRCRTRQRRRPLKRRSVFRYAESPLQAENPCLLYMHRVQAQLLAPFYQHHITCRSALTGPKHTIPLMCLMRPDPGATQGVNAIT